MRLVGWCEATFSRSILASLLLITAMVLSSCNAGSLSDGLSSATKPQPSQTVGASDSQIDQSGQINVDASNTPSQDGTQQGTQVAMAPGSKPVAFLPVSNAPQSAVTNLARSLKGAASSNGLPVVASVQQGAQFQVKGYFSALEDGSGTLLVYVWDVLDRNNKRVYRINGQEQTSGKSADPWSSVTPQMLDRVAQSTVSQLKSWLGSRG